MENDERDVSRWVDDRLSALDPPHHWRADSTAALARLRRREDTQRRHRLWLWASALATAAAVCAGFLALTAPPACANPLGCTQPVRPAPAVREALPEPAAPGPSTIPMPPPAGAHSYDFKQTGSPAAPLTCEIYSDFECPHCAAFYLQTVPQLVAQYVQTGKVRLIHRDYPLPRHRYAGLAARYANAAGESGYYSAAATQIFRTQALWSADGAIDGQVARVIPPAVMAKVRERVKDDQSLDDGLAADLAAAREDHLNQTPTLVIVSKGNRRVLPGNLSFNLLQTYLDQLLAQQ
jgi:protein-disulfide isomerase